MKAGRECSECGCDRPVVSRGMCVTHYRRWLRARQTPACAVPGCEHRARTSGLCEAHYKRQQHGGDLAAPIRARVHRIAPGSTCEREGCSATVYALGLCRAHYLSARHERRGNVATNCAAPAGNVASATPPPSGP